MNIFRTSCHAFICTKTEAPAQVFSCEFCNIFKNTYFVEHLQMAVTEMTRYFLQRHQILIKYSSYYCFKLLFYSVTVPAVLARKL